ncbi:Carboxymethylenebutenolidase [Aphelenchoides besseyi]|nr:Carboxymethylenebutenolidase [Aphelenchoides besseyi]
MSVILTSKRVYRDGNQTLQGFLARSKNLKKEDLVPAVIIFHTSMGLTDFEKKRAKFIAKHNLIGFAADIYGSHIRNTTKEEGVNCARIYAENRNTLLRSRLKAVLSYVSSLPFVNKNKVDLTGVLMFNKEFQLAAIGFGFGGMCCLDLARNNLGIQCGVVFHGILTPLMDYANVEPIQSKLLILHGDLDETSNKEVERLLFELRERQADFQFVRYSEAEEDFAIPNSSNPNASPGCSYNPTAAKRSSELMLMLFSETLGVPKPLNRLSLPKYLHPRNSH